MSTLEVGVAWLPSSMPHSMVIRKRACRLALGGTAKVHHRRVVYAWLPRVVLEAERRPGEDVAHGAVSFDAGHDGDSADCCSTVQQAAVTSTVYQCHCMLPADAVTINQGCSGV